MDYIPGWHRELEVFHSIKPVIILEGNVLDKYQYPLDGSIGQGSIVKITEYLHYYFKDCGYQNIIFYDSIRGFYNQCEEGYLQRFGELVNIGIDSKYIRADFKGKKGGASAYIHETITQGQEASVVVMDFASRYIISPDQMNQGEIDSFTVLLQASMEGKDVRTKQGMLKNLLILVVNKVNDIPAWFYIDNPNVKTIRLSTPTREERKQLVKGTNFPSFFAPGIYDADISYYREHPKEFESILDRFVALTEGFTFTELNSLRRLSKLKRFTIKNLCDVIDLYKFGMKENPWKTLDYLKLKNAYSELEKRVKGQQAALNNTIDVIKRTVVGLSGLQHSSHSRPRGVLFFAGPTGTGKTETAKALAELLFGDESCCLRFDMSEYSQAHSDQKLLGAPPGYVGYEAGGQLTNAVKKQPYSILLFDEIEKSHPSVLDKFLQILEDGRMTDGQGNTVYFSETIIIFTSNLGIYKTNSQGERYSHVDSSMPYEETSGKIRKEIEDYFKLQLGRPEILNRIGENIVVFDFIRKDAGELILKAQVQKIVKVLYEDKNITLHIAEEAMRILTDKALDNLENGARGVGNILEIMLINPLSRYLFDHGILSNAEITISSIRTNEQPYSLVCLEAVRK